MERMARLSAILLAIFMVGGCAPSPKAKELKRINIALPEWVGHGLFYLAQEKGFCKEEGIELVFIDN
jgi:ABC-type nitrate/sulfonate/bicarbonate transport system substrate-binding protein